MDTLLHHPAAGVRTPAARPPGGAPGLRLVESPCLILARPCPGNTPESWHTAIARLGRWLDLDLAQIPRRQASGLQRVTTWAAAASGREGSAHAPPVFAPGQCWSPVSLQQPGKTALPHASWVASYLYYGGPAKPLGRGAVDIQLLSPLPSACLPGEGEDRPIPKPDALRAMIKAARSEGRERIAIVTDAQRLNTMIRQLLLLDRSMTRDCSQIEVLSIESALCRLVHDRSRWDGIIVLPELRSLMFAMLAQLYAISSPWPMLWQHRGVTMICAEQLEGGASDLPLDAPLLVQALALAARQAGLGVIARQLIQGVARLWDCGIVTPGRGTVAPYVTEVGDDEFIEQLCRGVAGGQRAVASWRAVPEGPVPAASPAPSRLRLVGRD
jgi:hypothetical protein